MDATRWNALSICQGLLNKRAGGKVRMKKFGLIAASVAAIGGALYLNSQVDDAHFRYERVVREAYVRALDRDPGAGYQDDPGAMGYENAVRSYYEGGEEPLSPSAVFDELVGSEEYNVKNPGQEQPPVEPPIEPPPTECQGEPDCYIHIDRVDDILNGTSTQNLGLMHWCPFTNWRDPRDVGNKCGNDVANYLGFGSSAEILSFGEVEGMELCVEGDTQIVPQLQKENRRCDPDNPNYDERFLKADGSCGRSEMRKSRLVEYRARLDPHQNRAIGLRARGGECRTALIAAGGGTFDSVAGFCSALKKAEAETGFTVDDCPNQ